MSHVDGAANSPQSTIVNCWETSGSLIFFAAGVGCSAMGFAVWMG